MNLPRVIEQRLERAGEFDRLCIQQDPEYGWKIWAGEELIVRKSALAEAIDTAKAIEAEVGRGVKVEVVHRKVKIEMVPVWDGRWRA